jgi:multidrug efflux pump subunit AcrB
MLKQVGFSFLPEQESGELDIAVEAPAGTNIERTNSVLREMEAVVSKFPEVIMYNGIVGSNNAESNKGSIFVKLVPYDKRALTTSQMRGEVRRALRPIALRESMTLSVNQSGGGGGGRQLSFFIQGNDLEKLKILGEQIIEKIYKDVPGVVDLQSSMREGQSELQFSVNRERLTAFQLSVQQVGEYLRGLVNGLVASKYREEGSEFDMRVQLDEKSRADAVKIRSLKIPNSRGELIPLESISSHQSGFSPAQITRIDNLRGVSIDGDLAPGVPLAQTLTKVKASVDPILPVGYNLEFQGQAKSLKDLANGGLIAISLAVLFIYMIMASLYESLVLPFSILLTLPLAIVGAVFGLLITGKFLDIYSMIGVILLLGLVTKNAILVVDYVEQLRARGVERMEALLEGGVRRFKPVLMTSVAMIAGMIPVAIGYGEINKSRAGMGIVAIGGLLSSTLLSLVVVPCAYVYFDNVRSFFAKRRSAKKLSTSDSNN